MIELSEGKVLSCPSENDWIYLFEDIEIDGFNYNYYETFGIGHPYKLNEYEKAHIEKIKPYIKERAIARLKDKLEIKS